jgi:hypothetical protein
MLIVMQISPGAIEINITGSDIQEIILMIFNGGVFPEILWSRKHDDEPFVILMD